MSVVINLGGCGLVLYDPARGQGPWALFSSGFTIFSVYWSVVGKTIEFSPLVCCMFFPWRVLCCASELS
jgi:hypothetical protein